MNADWIPIDSAPKDGRTILGYFPQFVGYIARQDVVPITWIGWGGGVWQNATSGHNIIGAAPTGWMPLPQPPEWEKK